MNRVRGLGSPPGSLFASIARRIKMFYIGLFVGIVFVITVAIGFTLTINRLLNHKDRLDTHDEKYKALKANLDEFERKLNQPKKRQ